MDVMEEQLVGVHGEMMSVKGDLQRLGPLEVKVDTMLEKRLMLEKMENMLQKWENSEKASSSEEKKEKSSDMKEPRSAVIITPPRGGSSGMKNLPQREREANPLPDGNPHSQRMSEVGKIRRRKNRNTHPTIGDAHL